MSRDKQIEANQKNALLSTGPISPEGKSIVSMNAIKHGIFTKELIINTGIGQESETEYLELLNNLIICLAPIDQIQNLLVEKIAMDFWRLRRLIKFETGSIREYLDEVMESYYDKYENKKNEKIDLQINFIRSKIDSNNFYIKCLEEGLVTFENPIWKGNGIEKDILNDFYIIASAIDSNKKTKEDRNKIHEGKFDFVEIQDFLKKQGFTTNQELSSRLIELYIRDNQKLEEEIYELELQKLKNIEIEELNSRVCALPVNENVDKIIKYEKSIQKSIFQNLFLLKKLQGLL